MPRVLYHHIINPYELFFIRTFKLKTISEDISQYNVKPYNIATFSQTSQSINLYKDSDLGYYINLEELEEEYRDQEYVLYSPVDNPNYCYIEIKSSFLRMRGGSPRHIKVNQELFKYAVHDRNNPPSTISNSLRKRSCLS